MSHANSPIAVLTGDIIQSSDLAEDQLKTALATLAEAAGKIGDWPGTTTAFSLRGGDSWQMAMTTDRYALRAGLCLRAALRGLGKGFDSRIAITLGVDSMPPDGNPNAALGPVYIASGRLLEEIKGDGGIRWQAPDAADPRAYSAVARLADHISRDWTKAQARALIHHLPPAPPKREETAKRLGITRQSVNKSLWSAGFPALSEALDLVETAAIPSD